MLAIRDIITPRLSTADAKVITAFVLWIAVHCTLFLPPTTIILRTIYLFHSIHITILFLKASKTTIFTKLHFLKLDFKTKREF